MPAQSPSSSRQIHEWDICRVSLVLCGYDGCGEQEGDGVSEGGKHCQLAGVVGAFVTFARD